MKICIVRLLAESQDARDSEVSAEEIILKSFSNNLFACLYINERNALFDIKI